MTNPKYERRFGRAESDQRTSAERDRDRVLYTTAFRRLASVTQVVGALEGHTFHNRLTHSLEVAQVARRLAQKLQKESPPDLLDALGGVDPDVAEAAALAHDLGHPPFGHVAEEELNDLALENDDPDGFEGNAQSFRIIVRLAAHGTEYCGLNLTRGTLNAVLKYPKLRDGAGKRKQKFGSYETEKADFSFARQGSSEGIRCVEAVITDYADAIAYSVHDLDDFYRAGLVPLEHLRDSPTAFEEFLVRWAANGGVDSNLVAKHAGSLRNLLDLLPTTRRYSGSYPQRVALREATSRLIKRFIYAIELQSPTESPEPLRMDEEAFVQMQFLHGLVFDYVIKNHRLATQQHGQRTVVRGLFAEYHAAVRRAAHHGDRSILPELFVNQLDDIRSAATERDRAQRITRMTLDIVASFADAQAFALFHRLTGTRVGSVSDMLSN